MVVKVGRRVHGPHGRAMVLTAVVCSQVQTNGKKTPIAAVQHALQDLSDEVQDIRKKFQHELNVAASAPVSF